MKIVECVPNFSEGRRKNVVDEIKNSIKSVSGITLLDTEMDYDHNRSVITFVGGPEEVVEAAFAGISKAAELINMNEHEGQHPRMGATDVCPFIPIEGVSMDDAVALVVKLGERVGEELHIPVYLYEEAASSPNRVNLADVRRGQYEGIKEEIKTNPARKPDFGPSELGTAGATAIGARKPLIAYNINLSTSDVKIAKKIAKAIREKTGGYKYVKALGLEIKERNIAQVSMNLTDYTKTPIHRVFETVKSEAERYGVNIIGSEVVGLIPMKAIVKTADFYLRLEKFKSSQILESRLRGSSDSSNLYDKTIIDFANSVAKKTSAPGGGSVAALAGSMSASLNSMVSHFTIGKKGYEDVEDEMKHVLQRSTKLKNDLIFNIEDDKKAFREMVKAMKEGDENGVYRAIEVPLKTAEMSFESMQHSYVAVEKGNANTVTDAIVSAYMAYAGVMGGVMNAKINLGSVSEETKMKFVSRIDALISNADELMRKVREKVQDI